MSPPNGRSAIPVFVKDTLGEAQKRLAGLEKEAQKFAKDFVSRSRAAQKDLQKDLGRELERLQKRGSEIIEDPRLDRFRGRAREVTGEVVGRLEELQTSILNLVGVASREQVESVAHELRRLSRKVEAMTKSARRSKSSGSITVS
jgi:hypothetical protein